MNNDSTLDPRVFVRTTAMAERVWNNEIYRASNSNQNNDRSMM